MSLNKNSAGGGSSDSTNDDSIIENLTCYFENGNNVQDSYSNSNDDDVGLNIGSVLENVNNFDNGDDGGRVADDVNDNNSEDDGGDFNFDSVQKSDIETFIKIKDTLSNLKINFEKEINDVKLFDQNEKNVKKNVDDLISEVLGENTNLNNDNSIDVERNSQKDKLNAKDYVTFNIHSSVIYNGNRLNISKQLTKITMKPIERDMFIRIVNTFSKLIMGEYDEKLLILLRQDHDYLIEMWKGVKDSVVESSEMKNNSGMKEDINNLMKTMLETPMYFTTSCIALIACGNLLRNLYSETYDGKNAENIYDLLNFLRKNIRHVDVDPFECNCNGSCSKENKLLLSLILEIPTIIHSQTYLLQVLAYLMYDKSGREEIFILNMKNIISPGIIDKLPIRTAMLLGTIDRNKIKKRINDFKSESAHYTSICSNSRINNLYGKNTLNKIINTINDNRIKSFLDKLPCSSLCSFIIDFPKCKNKENCKKYTDSSNNSNISMSSTSSSSSSSSFVNNKSELNSCCGRQYVKIEDLFISSVSLCQLFIYACTNTNKASQKSQQHFYVRDIIMLMSQNTIGVDTDSMEEAFGFIDRTDLFTGFEKNPMMTMALHKLINSYINCMESVAEKYKNISSRDKRKMSRKMDRQK